MKKTLLFAVTAIAAMIATSCNKDSNSNKNSLDAELTLSSQIGTVTYGQPVELEGTVVSDATVTRAVAVTAKDAVAVGTEQELKVEGDKVSGLVFIDSHNAGEIKVTLGAGDKSKDFSFPIEKVTAAAKKIGFYANDALCMQADSLVPDHVNSPELYPVEFTSKGSEVPSFFSMLGTKVKGETKHILNLNEARSVDGKNLSFCWVNVLKNTANGVFIGGQRGYMFSGCKASSLGGGTTGRQCDIYEADGHQIKDENIDDFGMTVVNGQWIGEQYNEKLYKFVDSLYINIPEKNETELDMVKGVWNLSKLQQRLDNATLGEETEPTSLANKTYLRRYADAGDTSKKALVENFKAGDYVILRSKVKVGEDECEYYYGILQVLQLYDDSSAMASKEDGKMYIDREKGKELFFKPNYFAVKVQCLAE